MAPAERPELLTKHNQVINIGCNEDTRNNQTVVWISQGEDGLWHGHQDMGASSSSLTRYWPVCKKNIDDNNEAWELDNPDDSIGVDD